MLIRFPTGLAIISIGGIAFFSFTANYTIFTIASSPRKGKGPKPFGRSPAPHCRSSAVGCQPIVGFAEYCSKTSCGCGRVFSKSAKRHHPHYIFLAVSRPFLTGHLRLPPRLYHALRRNSAECRQLRPRRPNRRVHPDLHHPRIWFVMEIVPYIFV